MKETAVEATGERWYDRNQGMTVYKVAASRTCRRREVVPMTTYEALSLMMTFGVFLITLLAYIDRNNKRK